MKKFLQRHKLKLIGALVGAIAGYLYYHYIGCTSGTCPITSNPYISIIYGTLLGVLFFDLFNKKDVQHSNNKETKNN